MSEDDVINLFANKNVSVTRTVHSPGTRRPPETNGGWLSKPAQQHISPIGSQGQSPRRPVSRSGQQPYNFQSSPKTSRQIETNPHSFLRYLESSRRQYNIEEASPVILSVRSLAPTPTVKKEKPLLITNVVSECITLDDDDDDDDNNEESDLSKDLKTNCDEQPRDHENLSNKNISTSSSESKPGPSGMSHKGIQPTPVAVESTQTKAQRDAQGNIDAFLQLCKTIDKTEDMEKVIQGKVLKHFKNVDESFRKSTDLKTLLLKLCSKIEKDPANIYVHIADLVAELKCRKAKSNSRMDEAPAAKKAKMDTEALKKKLKDEHEELYASSKIKKLSILLAKLNKAIKKLEVAEVDWDDDNDSHYLRLQRFRKRAAEVYAKICEYTDEVAVPRARIPFSGTPFPDVNKSIERFIHKTGQFPDYKDILDVVKAAGENLNISTSEMENIARQAFTEIGEVMQKQRQRDDANSLFSILDDAGNIQDPAEHDDELKTKLDDNTKHWSKINDIIDEYATKSKEQREEENEDASSKGEDDESTESEEEEENEEEEDNDASDVGLDAMEDGNTDSCSKKDVSKNCNSRDGQKENGNDLKPNGHEDSDVESNCSKSLLENYTEEVIEGGKQKRSNNECDVDSTSPEPASAEADRGTEPLAAGTSTTGAGAGAGAGSQGSDTTMDPDEEQTVILCDSTLECSPSKSDDVNSGDENNQVESSEILPSCKIEPEVVENEPKIRVRSVKSLGGFDFSSPKRQTNNPPQVEDVIVLD